MKRRTLAEYVVFPSDLGWMGMAISWNELDQPQVDHLTFGHENDPLAGAALASHTRASQLTMFGPDTHPETRDWIERLQDFATGRFVDLSLLRLNLGYLTQFGHRVIEACRRVPWGETTSYGELARQVGSPGASRAVGGVMARNRHPLVVPCHRIIASNGSLVGFSAPTGTRMKDRLLRNEGR